MGYWTSWIIMSRKMKAWKFAKRVNSLAIPESAGVEYDILLKESCSLDTPVFLLNTNDFPYNYLFFEGKYFLIGYSIHIADDQKLFIGFYNLIYEFTKHRKRWICYYYVGFVS